MKVGDLVIVPKCLAANGNPPIKKCGCFFCCQNSHRIGVIIEIENQCGVAQFDVGEWIFYPADVYAGDVEVISETGTR